MRSTDRQIQFTHPGTRRPTAWPRSVAMAALLASRIARAEEPPPPPLPAPPETPSSPPPNATASAPPPAPTASAPDAGAPSNGALPDAVRAMVGQDVVLSTRDGRKLRGKLVAAGDAGFIVELPGGARENVARAQAKSIRIAGSMDSLAPPTTGQSTTGSAATPGDAETASGEASASEGAGPKRVVGIGTSFGGGVAGVDTFSGAASSGVQPALLLPTLELLVFMPRDFSLNLIMPVLNMALVSAVAKGTVVNMDLIFNANVGRGKTRFVAGAGLGFAFVDVPSGEGASLRIPAQLGFESLSKRRGFGFKLLARPWAEIAVGSSGDAFGGGVLGVLVFTGYMTDRTGAEDP